MTPTYVPAIFFNIYNANADKAQAIRLIVTKALPVVVKILDEFRSNRAPTKFDETLTLNFNKVAGQVRDDITILENPTYQIHPDGLVELIKRS